METITIAKDITTVAHQHTSGEIRTAVDLEAAQTMCPVLGRLSLEEAGLLLELEAIGKDHTASAAAIDRHGPMRSKEEVIKKDIHNKHPSEKADSSIEETITTAKPIAALSAVSAANKHGEPTYDDSLVAEVPSLKGGNVQYARQSGAAEATMEHQAHVESTKVSPVPIEAMKTVVEFDTGQVAHPVVVSEAKPQVNGIDRSVRDQPAHPTQEVDRRTDSTDRGAVGVMAPHPMGEQAQQIESTKTAHGQVLDGIVQEEVAHYEREEVINLLPVGAKEEKPAGAEIKYDPIDIAITTKNSTATFVGIDGIGTTNFLEPSIATFVPAGTQPEVVLPRARKVEKVELIINSLAEAIEEYGPEELGAIYNIAGRIVNLSETMDVSVEGENVAQSLEELFVELLEENDIDYSADIVSALVSVVRKGRGAERIEAMLKKDEANQELPEQPGTREFLQKMTHRVVPVRLSLAKLYSIGRSALGLYRLKQVDGQLAA